ncbi:hypothetical protein ACE1SV_71520 [Streptomyces sp. E-15]
MRARGPALDGRALAVAGLAGLRRPTYPGARLMAIVAVADAVGRHRDGRLETASSQADPDMFRRRMPRTGTPLPRPQ